jgi:hypothetical protein
MMRKLNLALWIVAGGRDTLIWPQCGGLKWPRPGST